MKKRLLSMLLIISLVLVSAAGCSKDISTQYHDALEKTSKIEKSTQSIEFEMNIDPSGLNLSPEEQAQFQMFSNIKGKMDLKLDTKGKLGQFDGNISLSGIAVSAKGFIKDDKFVLQIPMLPQYLVADMKDLTAGQAAAPDTKKLQESLSKKVSPLWKETLTKDKIKKLGDKKITIGESEVKTTEFEFSLSNDEINKLILNVIKTVVQDEEFKKIMISTLNQQNPSAPISESEFDTQINTALPELEKILKDIKVENFKYTGNIDKDSYLVQENAAFTLNANIPDAGKVKMDFKFTLKRSDIGKEVKVEMPETNETNSINIKDLMNDPSGLFSDINE